MRGGISFVNKVKWMKEGWNKKNFFDILSQHTRWKIILIILLNSSQAGSASRFFVEANIKALLSKSNSRRSKKIMVWGLSIQPQSEYLSKYWITFGRISNKIQLFFNYPLRVKRAREFIEIRHNKISPTPILSTLGGLWLCDSVANNELICFTLTPIHHIRLKYRYLSQANI